jgi:hypothetical protein
MIIIDMQGMERSTTNSAAAGESASSGGWRTKSVSAGAAVAAAGATSLAAARLPEIKIQTAQDIGRTKWEPARDVSSAEQGKLKLRGILNKLTPDNFDNLLPEVGKPYHHVYHGNCAPAVALAAGMMAVHASHL